MRRRVSAVVTTVFLAAGCASGGGSGPGAAEPVVSQSGGECPPAPGEKPYTISVSNRSGDSASAAVRQAIANALASAWGEDEKDRARKPAAYYPAMRELAIQVPQLPRYGLGKSRLRAGDTAVALLTYRRGQLPELDLPSTIRPELHHLISRATGTAIGDAMMERSIRDTLPLEIPGSGGDAVTLEVRFGWTPRDGAAVATFALRESQPTPIRSSAIVRYPDEYRLQNIEGSVLTMFIITETGDLDRSSIRVISSDGPLFTQSVLRFLSLVRFQPYRLDCVMHPIAVTQPFDFSLRR